MRRKDLAEFDLSTVAGTCPLGEPGQARSGRRTLPVELQFTEEEAVEKMQPGEIFLLACAESLTGLVEPVFVAILACPQCGLLNLITAPQYFGTTPVTCESRFCSCRFRIGNQSSLEYLPAN